MGIRSLCNHLRHPVTYTDVNGQAQQLSSQEMSCVTIVVLLLLPVGAAEAIKSNRSLKSSFITIGILAGAAFYIATAIMKMMSGGNGSGRGKGPPKQEPNMLEVSGLMGNSGWFSIDDDTPKFSGPEVKKETPRTQGQGTGIKQTLKPSENLPISQDTLLVSGLMGQSTWICINNSPQSSRSELQETPSASVTAAVKKEEEQKIQDDETFRMMQISVIGSSEKSEWVYMNNPASSFISTGVKEEKREIDLTVSVFGLEVNEWVSIADSSNVSRPYQLLTVTNDQIKVISKMIKLIGNTLLPLLYFKKDQLLEMGKQIENVHPLKFLETILNTPKIKKSMLEIKGNKLKWGGFLKGDSESPGFIAKCQREVGLGIFEPHLIDFCQAVKVDSQTVLSLFEAKKWEELILFLIK